jgi:hypothetical protein
MLSSVQEVVRLGLCYVCYIVCIYDRFLGYVVVCIAVMLKPCSLTDHGPCDAFAELHARTLRSSVSRLDDIVIPLWQLDGIAR